MRRLVGTQKDIFRKSLKIKASESLDLFSSLVMLMDFSE